MVGIVTEYPNYFTATNLEWKMLLQPDKYKDIVVGSLRFLVEDLRIVLYAFVIMGNHIHLIWQMKAGILKRITRLYWSVSGWMQKTGSFNLGAQSIEYRIEEPQNFSPKTGVYSLESCSGGLVQFAGRLYLFIG